MGRGNHTAIREGIPSHMSQCQRGLVLDPAQGVRFHFDFGQLSWSRCAESESATIHLNPVKHGLVAAPKAWPHSSFTEWVARDVYEPTWGLGEMPELPVWAKLAE